MLNDKRSRAETAENIHERIYRFSLGVIHLTRALARTDSNRILVRQVIRSATSIGANALEAESGSSKKEFIYGMTIAKKEAKETWYWLRLLRDTNERREFFEKYIDEVDQIVKILSSIIIAAKKRL